MSTFQDQLAADLTSVFFNVDEFAIGGVTYTTGGVSTTITVVPCDEDLSGQTLPTPGDSMILMVKYSDAASPGWGDTFTINGTVWSFVELVGGGQAEGVWHIRVSRSARRRIG